MILGILIGAVSCTDANGSLHKTANGIAITRVLFSSKTVI